MNHDQFLTYEVTDDGGEGVAARTHSRVQAAGPTMGQCDICNHLLTADYQTSVSRWLWPESRPAMRIRAASLCPESG